MDEPMKCGRLVIANGVVARITAIRPNPFEYAELVGIESGRKFQCPTSKMRYLTDFETVMTGLL